ncbi:hypothetical protein HDV00_000878, partial [Rhizophlyctis rosea]
MEVDGGGAVEDGKGKEGGEEVRGEEVDGSGEAMQVDSAHLEKGNVVATSGEEPVLAEVGTDGGSSFRPFFDTGDSLAIPTTTTSSDEAPTKEEIIDNILKENNARARLQMREEHAHATREVAPTSTGAMKIHRGPDDYEFHVQNIETYNRIRGRIVKDVRARVLAHAQKQAALRERQAELERGWMREVEKLDREKTRRKRKSGKGGRGGGGEYGGGGMGFGSGAGASGAGGSGLLSVPVGDAERRETGYLPSRSGRRSVFTSDMVKSELEFQQAIRSLGVQDETAPEEDRYAKEPDMILDPLERKIASFQSWNGYVADAAKDLEEYNARFEMRWSEAEREVFKQRLVQYGKNFSKIAGFLPLKNVQDCVEYYYRCQAKGDGGLKQVARQSVAGRRRNRRGKARAVVDEGGVGSSAGGGRRSYLLSRKVDEEEDGEGAAGEETERKEGEGRKGKRGKESGGGDGGEGVGELSDAETAAMFEAFVSAGAEQDYGAVALLTGRGERECRSFFNKHRRDIRRQRAERVAEEG